MRLGCLIAPTAADIRDVMALRARAAPPADFSLRTLRRCVVFRGKDLNKAGVNLIIVVSSGPETAIFAFAQGRVFADPGRNAGLAIASR
jgi:hypothetical protein